MADLDAFELGKLGCGFGCGRGVGGFEDDEGVGQGAGDGQRQGWIVNELFEPLRRRGLKDDTMCETDNFGRALELGNDRLRWSGGRGG